MQSVADHEETRARRRPLKADLTPEAMRRDVPGRSCLDKAALERALAN